MHVLLQRLPAAPSVWPYLAFVDAKAKLEASCRSLPLILSMAAPMAPVSIGSPRGVPVPWTANKLMPEISDDEPWKAERMSSCWAGPLGAVKEEDLPS